MGPESDSIQTMSLVFRLDVNRALVVVGNHWNRGTEGTTFLFLRA